MLADRPAAAGATAASRKLQTRFAAELCRREMQRALVPVRCLHQWKL